MLTFRRVLLIMKKKQIAQAEEDEEKEEEEEEEKEQEEEEKEEEEEEEEEKHRVVKKILFKSNHSLHPKPAAQLQIPPIGSNDKPLGQVYSHPNKLSYSILAQEMNFLHENGCGKLPISRHSI